MATYLQGFAVHRLGFVIKPLHGLVQCQVESGPEGRRVLLAQHPGLGFQRFTKQMLRLFQVSAALEDLGHLVHAV